MFTALERVSKSKNKEICSVKSSANERFPSKGHQKGHSWHFHLCHHHHQGLRVTAAKEDHLSSPWAWCPQQVLQPPLRWHTEAGPWLFFMELAFRAEQSQGQETVWYPHATHIPSVEGVCLCCLWRVSRAEHKIPWSQPFIPSFVYSSDIY